MLKQRLITAAILVPLVVWAILALPSQLVLMLFAAVALLAGWEWLQLMDFNATPTKLVLLALAFAIGWSSLAFLPFAVILFSTVMIWLLATLVVVFYAAKPLAGCLSQLFKHPLFGFFAMLLILTGFVASAGYLHSNWEQGPALLLFVMVTVWLADTGGYLAGKRFGKHKLAVAISPNKTWEGVIGAQLLALLWAVGFYFFVGGLSHSFISWLLLTVFIVMVSVVGDLLESVFKRCYHKKDSGQLLPGHGGILDRVDSLLAALPVFTVSLLAGAGL
jgi:phosphatidate cytidylyltransferase